MTYLLLRYLLFSIGLFALALPLRLRIIPPAQWRTPGWRLWVTANACVGKHLLEIAALLAGGALLFYLVPGITPGLYNWAEFILFVAAFAWAAIKTGAAIFAPLYRPHLLE